MKGIREFRDEVWRHWRESGRHDLPWRKTKNPYRILVSEVMLQQTQVPRVIGKYKEFLKAFPTVQKLAAAKLPDVLKIWSGLGYNRRGKYLHDSAKIIVREYGGRIPKAAAALRSLPGIRDYTASAVRVFAFNEPDILIETNIRTAYIYQFFNVGSYDLPILDVDIHIVAAEAAEGSPPAGGPREWHWALMDYGAHLKRSGVRNNSRSAHYTKQSKFEGSLRQVRGEILRALARGEKHNDLRCRYGEKFELALVGLAHDGLIVKEKGKWRIA